MYSIDGNKITLTKGDSFYCEVNLKDDDGNTYEPVYGDAITFSLKKYYSERVPILSKNIPTDTMLLRLAPSDTADLPLGTYVYDMQLTTGNDVYTFISSTITLTAEVTR